MALKIQEIFYHFPRFANDSTLTFYNRTQVENDKMQANTQKTNGSMTENAAQIRLIESMTLKFRSANLKKTTTALL